jgi:hypothetical protein
MAKVNQSPIRDGEIKHGLWSWFQSWWNTTVDITHPQRTQPANGKAATPETNHTLRAIEASLAGGADAADMRTAEAEAEHEQECPTVLGIDQQTGNEIFLSEKTRSQLVTVSGAMGVGKSVFLASLIEQDIQQGRSVIVIDPHGPLVRQIVARMPEERLDDVIILDLASENAVGLNLFACPQPRTMHTRAATANSISHVFEKVFGTGVDKTPRLMQVLRAITRLLIDNDLTLAEIPLLFTSDALRAKMVANCTNSSIVSFWDGYNRRSQRDKDDLVASTMNKIMSFLDHDLLRLIVSQSKTTLDMRRILDEGKILLVSLSPQFQDAGSLIGATLISQLLRAMYARGATPENALRACALYCDEYASYATEDFATLCTEARKFRILTTLAFQVLETLDDVNRATALQAGTLVVFRVSGDDSKVYARSFDSTPTQEQTGWEPVRAAATDAITYLLRHGNPDTRVAKFAQNYLLNLENFLRNPPRPAVPSLFSPYWPASYRYRYTLLLTEWHVTNGRRLLNDCLYRAMAENNADVLIPPLALYILAAAQRDGREYALSMFVTCKGGPQLGGPRLLKGFNEAAERLGTPSFLKPKAQQAFLELCPRKHLWAAKAVIRMITELRHCLASLAASPVLTDTGKYKPVYRQRGFHDVEAEIANLIKTQDNYVAKVKVLTAEYTIRTAPPPPLLPDEQINERISYIKNNMLNLGICKPAHEIEEEIRLRQEKLLGPAQNDSPPPTHTNRRRFRQRPPTDA